MEADERFVKVNKHIDAADDRLVQLRGQFNSFFIDLIFKISRQNFLHGNSQGSPSSS